VIVYLQMTYTRSLGTESSPAWYVFVVEIAIGTGVEVHICKL
jgi:hypothetical protein